MFTGIPFHHRLGKTSAHIARLYKLRRGILAGHFILFGIGKRSTYQIRSRVRRKLENKLRGESVDAARIISILQTARAAGSG